MRDSLPVVVILDGKSIECGGKLTLRIRSNGPLIEKRPLVDLG